MVGCGLLAPAAAQAQSAPVVSQPVVQALPSPHTQRLNAALARLGRDPRDTAALLDAGDAARALGDFDAALGFYRRADEIAPNTARAKAGLGAAYVLTGDPVSAIPYFEAAEKAGAAPGQIAADRGLAYDLVGDNAAAQRQYAAALAGGGGDDVRIRLALSQAMAGDQKTAEATLMPLLRKQDKPAWRARAFTLAIAGETKQAVDVAQSILPPQLAENIAPYLRYMPRLTRAQQAAAANLGRFPRASEIGRDDPRIAAYAPPRVAAADAALIPKGEPLDGGRGSKRTRTRTSSRARTAQAEPREALAAATARKPALAAADPDRVAPPEPRPAIESSGELPPVGRQVELPPMSAKPAAAPPAVPATAALAAPAPAPAAASQPRLAASPAVASMPPSAAAQPPAATPPPRAAEAPAPGFDLARLPASAAPNPAPSSPAPQPAASPPPASAPPAPSAASLEEIFADLGRPALQAAPASGAVDIRRIAPPRIEAKPAPKPAAAAEAKPDKPVEKPKPKKPAPPAHPSRIWVQLGVGRNKDAIAFDWRRYAKQAPALFKGRQAHVSEMGRTNRILAGPFQTQKAANDFIADLKKAGIDEALPWTSPAGQVVDELPTK